MSYSVETKNEREHYRVLRVRAGGLDDMVWFMENAHKEGWATLTCNIVTDSYKNFEWSWTVLQTKITGG